MDNDLNGAVAPEAQAPTVAVEAPEAAAPEAEPQIDQPEQSEPQHKDRAAKRIARLIAEKHALQRERDALAAVAAQSVAQPEPDVNARAQQIIEEREFNAQADALYAKGVTEFPGSFRDAVQALNSVAPGGVMSRDFVDMVLALPNGAAVINALGTDVDRAADIFDLSPAKMAIEVAKLSGKLGSTAQRPVSRTPAPPSPISGPSTTATADPSKMSMQEFAVWWDSERKAGRLR